MSRPRDKWWWGALRVVQEYPILVEKEKQLRETSITASYNGMPGGGTISNPTADAVERTLSSGDQRELDAVRAAIRETEHYRDGTSRLKVVSLTRWKKTHTIAGAAMQLNPPVSERTAAQYHGDFIRAVIKHLDLP